MVAAGILMNRLGKLAAGISVPGAVITRHVNNAIRPTADGLRRIASSSQVTAAALAYAGISPRKEI